MSITSQQTRIGLQEIAIQDIWLIREGGETSNADVVLYVKRDGIWYEAIREHAEGSFSHCISANGLVSEHCKPADWLNKDQAVKEQAV